MRAFVCHVYVYLSSLDARISAQMDSLILRVWKKGLVSNSWPRSFGYDGGFEKKKKKSFGMGSHSFVRSFAGSPVNVSEDLAMGAPSRQGGEREGVSLAST